MKKIFISLSFILLTGCANKAVDANKNLSQVTSNTIQNSQQFVQSSSLESNSEQINVSDSFLKGNIADQSHESNHVTPKISSLKGATETATIIMPQIQNITDKNTLSKIENLFSFKNVVGENLEETIANFQNCECGVVGVDYQVLYDKNHILDIAFTVDNFGAYPDSSIQNYALDLSTGEVMKINQIFKPESLKKLANLSNTILQKNIDEAKQNSKDNTEILGLFSEKNYQFLESNLENFTIKNTGIEFKYDFEFPHVIEAAEPKSVIFFSYKELANYLSNDGLLKTEILKY